MAQTGVHRLDPRTTALILIDLQRDFLDPSGVLGKAGQDVARMRRVIGPIRRLIVFARENTLPVIFIRFIDGLRYRNAAGRHMFEKKELSEQHLCCREGSKGSEFCDIVPDKGDTVVIKHSYDAFECTTLETILKEKGITTLIVSGVKTNGCVESTVRTAYHKGYRVIVPRECVATNTRREQESSLFTIDRYFGDVVRLSSIRSIKT
ncbi:cysteine hydrolase [Patescibacteria group bacterium]|nr:cysteine hydrolase [Patescibacteria group bacterium]